MDINFLCNIWVIFRKFEYFSYYIIIITIIIYLFKPQRVNVHGYMNMMYR